MHFAAGAVNKLTSETVDPQASIPEYELSSVRVEAFGPDAGASVLRPDVQSGARDGTADD